MGKKRRLLDEYRFPGFRPKSKIQGTFGDPRARVIQLQRTQKKQFVDAVAPGNAVITTKGNDKYGTCHAGMHVFTCQWRFGEFSAGSAGK